MRKIEVVVFEINDSVRDKVYQHKFDGFPITDLIAFIQAPYDYSNIPALDYFIEGFKEALSMFPNISNKKRDLFLQQALLKFESNERSDSE